MKRTRNRVEGQRKTGKMMILNKVYNSSLIIRLFRFSLFILVLLTSGSVINASVVNNDNEEPALFLVSTLSNSKAVVGEGVYYYLKLYSSTPDVQQIRLTAVNSEVRNDGIVFEELGNERSSWEKEKYKGKEYYSVIVGSYLVDCKKAGDYKVGGNTYRLSVAKPVVVHDPFWGDRRQYLSKSYNVESTVVKLKVDKLPEKYVDMPVGSFSIETTIPPGYIKPGDTSIAVVSVEGNGRMPEVKDLNLQDVFARGGLTLKQTKPVLRHYMKNGQRVAELEIECTFIAPEAKEYTIPEIELKYYDSKGRSIKIARSESTTFEAGKVSKRSAPPVIQEI